MENNEFGKVYINDGICYYFDEIIKLEGFDLDNILTDKKPHENILIYGISYKTLIPLRIRFDKIDWFIRICDRTRYLTLFGSEKYGAIYNRILYLISLEIGIIYIFCHYFAEIKVNSYDYYLSIEKRLTLHNVILYIKSVKNKYKN